MMPFSVSGELIAGVSLGFEYVGGESDVLEDDEVGVLLLDFLIVRLIVSFYRT